MEIQQFEDKGLSHYSYAILDKKSGEVVIIDPARDISPYLKFASDHQATIIGVIETHSHADFVSGHLELHSKAKAIVYCSSLFDATFPHQHFDEGDTLRFGDTTLYALHTPGHSADSICIVLEYNGSSRAVFTGDTLFIGDCGRPDLRESANQKENQQKLLARQMYHSLRNKLMMLQPETIVYPAHGAGSLCGKALSEAHQSTIGAEIETNWSLQPMPEEEFTEKLTSDLPFIPHYFAYDVALNKAGAENLEESVQSVPFVSNNTNSSGIIIVDTRPAAVFKKAHFPGAINIPDGGKFETWLGAVLLSEEKYFLYATAASDIRELLLKSAKIGYETLIEGVIQQPEGMATVASAQLDVLYFKHHTEAFTIVDVRNAGEVKEAVIFPNSLSIPLPELRQRLSEIPVHQPIVVHCAGGYRSAIAASLLEGYIQEQQQIYDLGETVKDYLHSAG